MKTPYITKRDIKCFLLGIATIYAADVAVNWESHKIAFIRGVEDGSADVAKSTEGLRLEERK